MTKCRVLVVGTRGIGTVCVYTLEKGGMAEVPAVLRSNYEFVLKNGIDIDSTYYGNENPDISRGGFLPFDYIVVTTKNIPDVCLTVADIIAPAMTPGRTTIVLCQNGLNIEKPITLRFPTNPVISSVVFTGALETLHGKVHSSDPDTQKIGPLFSPRVPTHVAENAARRYIAIYNPTGELDITFDSEVAGSRWRKLAYNSSSNSVSAILRMDSSRMRMNRYIIDDLIIPIIREIRACAEARGDPPNPEFKPSMCQDIEKGNLMEIESIVGEPLHEGERYGVPMPTLRIVYSLLKGLQSQIKESKGLWKPDTQSSS